MDTAIEKQDRRKKLLKQAIHRKGKLDSYIKRQGRLIKRKQKVIDEKPNK